LDPYRFMLSAVTSTVWNQSLSPAQWHSLEDAGMHPNMGD
jgi:hypothetical protein